MTTQSLLLALPQDTIEHSLSLLSPKDLAKVLPTCKQFKQSANGIFIRCVGELRMMQNIAIYSQFSNLSAKTARNRTEILDLTDPAHFHSFSMVRCQDVYQNSSAEDPISEVLASKHHDRGSHAIADPRFR